ncbi:MAG: hypothetical protein ACRD7E_25415 [Bryobacteraceae bacterium]
MPVQDTKSPAGATVTDWQAKPRAVHDLRNSDAVGVPGVNRGRVAADLHGIQFGQIRG